MYQEISTNEKCWGIVSHLTLANGIVAVSFVGAWSRTAARLCRHTA